MRVVVFGSSALIKHDHDEPGTAVVDSTFDDQNTVRIITDITLIEFHSAFARCVRMGEITPEDYRNAKAELVSDVREGRLSVESLSEADKAEAALLLTNMPSLGNYEHLMHCNWPS